MPLRVKRFQNSWLIAFCVLRESRPRGDFIVTYGFFLAQLLFTAFAMLIRRRKRKVRAIIAKIIQLIM